MIKDRTIDRKSNIPLHQQLRDILKEEIDSGEYPPESMIPTEAELGEMFGLSRTTVRVALVDLVKSGRVYRVKSKGTFVSQPKVTWEQETRWPTFTNAVRIEGKRPQIEVLKQEIIKVDEQLEQQEFTFSSSKVVHLHRIRLVDTEPICVQHTYINYDLAGFTVLADWEKAKLHQMLDEKPESKTVREYRICQAELADGNDAQYLGINVGSPILALKIFGFNKDGVLIEYTNSRYRADKGQLHTDFPR